jgi:hypothetical protein
MVEMLRTEAKRRPLDFFACEELARLPLFRENGISARALSAKVRSLGLPYRRLGGLTKNGKAIQFKADLIRRIEDVTGIIGLKSLRKADKTALLRLTKAIESQAAVRPSMAEANCNESRSRTG